MRLTVWLSAITSQDGSRQVLTGSPVTDYGGVNPLFYGYYGFQPELYRLKFKSRGDSLVSKRVVELFLQRRACETASLMT